jgi:hypothetical protein
VQYRADEAFGGAPGCGSEARQAPQWPRYNVALCYQLS